VGKIIMPFRFEDEMPVSQPLEKKKTRFKFEDEIEKEKEYPGLLRAAGNIPAEYLEGLVGSIPSLSTAQKQVEPYLQAVEEFAKPDYLPSSSLEPAPEKSFRNLLALIGDIPGIEKYTIENLRKKFGEITKGKFKPKNAIERILAHGASSAGAATPFGLGGISGAGGAAVLGQSLRELGVPEKYANTIEFLGTAFAPRTGNKNLVTKPNEKALVAYARKKGLNDNEITSLLKGEATTDILSHLAFKGPRTKKIAIGAESKLGEAFNTIKEEVRNRPRVSGEISEKLADKFGEILKNMKETIEPSPDKASVIKFVENAYENLINKGTTEEGLINFHGDINSAGNWKAIKNGKKSLAQLKKPVVEALKEANPVKGEEFDLLNKLYGKSKYLSKKLKPDMIDKIKTLGTAGTILTGALTFNLPLLKTGLGSYLGQIFARELLVNPKLHNLVERGVEAVNRNNIRLANSVIHKMNKLFAKKYPEEFKNIDFGKLEKSSEK
jgi:hypothetical protein